MFFRAPQAIFWPRLRHRRREMLAILCRRQEMGLSQAPHARFWRHKREFLADSKRRRQDFGRLSRRKRENLADSKRCSPGAAGKDFGTSVCLFQASTQARFWRLLRRRRENLAGSKRRSQRFCMTILCAAGNKITLFQTPQARFWSCY